MPPYFRTRDFWGALVTTILALLVVYLYLENRNFAHQSRVENCRALNELNLELRIAWADAGHPTISDRFESTLKCEQLP